LILNRLLEDLNQTPTPIQASRGVIRYDVFINKSGGTATVRDRVLAKSDSNLLDSLETGDLSIDTLKELKAKNPKIGYRPGIYGHVIYKSDNLNDAGLYVGSAIVLAERVKKHKKDQKGFQKRSRLGARKRKTKARSQSLHQKFWARERYRDFWLCLTELDLPNSAREIDDTDVLLNILEKYLALLLRSLSQRLLHLALPHGVDVDPYCWIGLNVADHLIQYRRSLYETKTAYFTRRTLSSKKRYVYNFKTHSLLNTMFRFADRSK